MMGRRFKLHSRLAGIGIALLLLLASRPAWAADKLYWIEANAIKCVNKDGSGSVTTLVTGISLGHSLAIDETGKKLYWVDRTVNKIARANLNGTSQEDVYVFDDSTTPFTLALNVAAGDLYFASPDTQTIKRGKMDGSEVPVVIYDASDASAAPDDTNAGNPGIRDVRGIALDIDAGMMYWADRGTGADRVVRGSIDGSTTPQLLYTQASGSAQMVALDIAAGMLYWSNSGRSQIERGKMDGSGSRESLYTASTGSGGGPVGLALDIPSGDLYWGATSADDIRRGKMEGSEVEGGTVVSLVSGLNNPLSVILAEGPAPGFTIAETDGGTTVAETGTTDTFTVVLDVQPSNDVVIDLSMPEGLVREFSFAPETLTFTSDNWSDPQTVTVTGKDDSVDDGNLEVDITLTVNDAGSDESYVDVTDQTLTVTTIDDDEPAMIVTESGSGTSVSENGGTDTFTVHISLQPESNVVLNVSSNDESKVTVSPTSLTFFAGIATIPQTVTVTGVNNAVAGGEITSLVSVSVNDALSEDSFDDLADETVSVTITDDEEPGFTVAESGGSTSVNEGGTTDTFTVVLDVEPVADVVLSVSSGDVGEATVSPAELTFTSENWDTAQTVTVTGVNDTLADGDQTSTLTVAVIDVSSHDAYDAVANQTVSVTTADDEVPGFTLVESDGSTSVNEGGTTDTFTVVLDVEPVADVVLSITSGDVGEATVSPAELTFTPENWDTVRTVTVTGVNDTLADGDQTSTLTVAVNDESSHDVYDAVANQTVSVTTVDNEVPGFTVAESDGSTSVNEGGTTDIFTVVLDVEPLSDVVLSVSSADVGEATVSPPELTFTPENWDTGQTVTVTGVDDAVVDGNQSTVITLGVVDVSSQDLFDSVANQTVTVTTVDNELNAAPGGVDGGLELWLRADADVFADTEGSAAADQQNVRLWNDQSGSEHHVGQDTVGDQPDFDSGAINFNPAIAFSEPSKEFFDPIDFRGFAGSYSIFLVAKSSYTAKGQLLLTSNDESGTGIHIEFLSNTGKLRFTHRGPASNSGGDSLLDGVRSLALPEFYSFFRASNTKHKYFLNGGSELSVAPTQNGLSDSEATNLYIGKLHSNVKYFEGQIAEIIVYNADVEASRAKIESYLGIKYGLTVSQDTTQDYLSSAGVTIWDASSNGAYQHDIAGIGRDDDSALDQRKSQSEETDAILTVALGDLTSPTAFATDESFLLWANDNDNDGSIEEISTERAVNVASRLDREWKFDLSGNVAAVDLEFNVAGIAVSGTTASDFVLLLDTDNDGDFTTGTVTRVAASTFSANKAVFDDVSIADGNVVTLATSMVPAGFTIAESDGSTSVSEAGTTDTFTVVLDTQPEGDVVLNITSGDVGEATVSPAEVTFTSENWNSVQTVTVTGVNDTLADGEQTTSVTVVVNDESSHDVYDSVADETVSVTTVDNEVPGFTLVEGDGSTSVNEGGATDTFTVVLDVEPVADVVLSVSSGDVGEVSVSPAELTFTSDNWNSPQTVTVSGVNDALADGSQTVLVSVSVDDEGSHDLFDPIADQAISVTNADNEIPGFTVSESDATTGVAEAGTSDFFTVVLDFEPLSDVVFNVASSDSGEVTVSPTTLTFSTGDWDSPQTVTVTGVDDGLLDGEQNSTITVSVDDGNSDDVFDGLASETVSVLTSDDELAGLTMVQTDGATTVSEDGTTDTFTVALSAEPLGNVDLLVSSGDLGEATVSPVALAFTPANWNNGQTVTVTGIDDDLVDGDQLSVVSLSVVDATSHDSFDALADQTLNVTTTDNDVAGLTITKTLGSNAVSESGGTVTFTVVLNSEPGSDVVIDVSSGDLGEVTISPASLTFTPDNWDSSQTVTITGVDDALVDGDQTSSVSLSIDDDQSDETYHSLLDQTEDVITADDELAGFTVSTTDGSTVVNEGGGTDTFTVQLDAEPVGDVVLLVSSEDLGEVTASPASLSFSPSNWDTGQTVTLTGQDDDLLDGDQSTLIRLTVNAGASQDLFDSVADQTVSVTTTDNEAAGITLAESDGTTRVSETGSTDSFSVVLTAAPLSDVVLSVTNGDPGELLLSPSELTFTIDNWNSPQAVTVTGQDDGDIDGEQTTILTVSVQDDASHDGFDGVADQTISVITTDDEVAGFTVAESDGATQVSEAGQTDSFTLVLTAPPASPVVLSISTANPSELTTSVNQVSFTVDSWETPQTVTVSAVDDDRLDGETSTSLTISIVDASSDSNFHAVSDQIVTVIALDNDVAGFSVDELGGVSVSETGTTDTFSVVLDAEPDSDVVVNLQSQDAGEVTVSPASLTFDAANWDSPQVVTVSGVDDDLIDGTITAAVEVSIGAGSDAKFTGLDAETVIVSVTDDDVAGFTVDEAGGVSVNETGTTDTFSVVLDAQPQSDVIFVLQSSDSGEAIVSPATLTLTPLNWNSPRTATLTGVDDVVLDGDQTITVTLSVSEASDASFTGLASQAVNVVVVDDDEAGFTIDEGDGISVSEAGTTDTFTVVMDAQPDSNVVLEISNPDSGEAILSPDTLTFTPANWDLVQTVTVTGVDDSIIDGDIGLSPELSIAAGSDAPFLGITAKAVSVTVVDDDVAGFTVVESEGGTSVGETGTTDSFSVVLDAQPASDVILDLASLDSGELAVSPTSLTFGADDWDTPQTVTVTGLDDPIIDGSQTIQVSITVDPGSDDDFDSLPVQTVEVTNVDDDSAGFTLSESDGQTVVGEAGTTDTFGVVLNVQPSSDVLISLESSNESEAIVSPSTLSFTPNDWDTPQTVTVTGVDDFAGDGDQGVTITVSVVDASSDDDFDGLPDQTLSVTNLDDDQPGIVVTESGGSTEVGEEGTTDTFTVALTLHPSSEVVINVTSEAPDEFLVSPSVLRFISGTALDPQEVTVTGVDDAVVDGNVLSLVTIAVNVANSHESFESVADQTLSVTTVDDEVAGLAVVQSDGGTGVEESGTTDSFTVALTNQPLSDVLVSVESGDVGEVAATPALLTFTSQDWDSPQTVSVQGVDDFVIDGNVDVDVTLAVVADSSDDFFDGVAPQTVSVINLDDDAAGFTVVESDLATEVDEDGSQDTLDVRLNVMPESDVVLIVSSADIGEATVAPESLTFTPENWNSVQTVSVVGVDDTVIDGDVTADVTFSVNDPLSDDAFGAVVDTVVLVTNKDNDQAGIVISETDDDTQVTENGSTDTVSVVLTAEPASTVVVALLSQDLTEVKVSPASLTFEAANWDLPQEATLTGQDDLLNDGDSTTLLAASVIAESSDPAFAAASASVEITTVDDDSPGLLVVESDGMTSVDEGVMGDAFTVALNVMPISDVTVQILPADNGEVTVSPSVITFDDSNWNQAVEVDVQGLVDHQKDGDQIVPVLVFVADAGLGDPLGDAEPVELNVTVIDLDLAGFTIAETDGGTTVSESGAGKEDSFSVVLDVAPAGNITVSAVSNDTSEVAVLSGDMLFTPENWNVPQDVRLSGVNDTVLDGSVDSVITVSLTAGVGDEIFQALDDQSVQVTTTDDEVAGIVVSQTGGRTRVTEGGGADNISVRFASQPLSDVVLTFATAIGDQIAGFPSTLTISPEKWNQPNTLGIFAIDDGQIESSLEGELVVSVNIATSEPLFSGVNPESITVTVLDNDAAGISVSHSGGSTRVNEGGGVDFFTVTLKAIPSSEVFFEIGVPANDEVSITPTLFSISPASWDSPVVIEVTGLDDLIVDGDQAVELSLSVLSSTDDPSFAALEDRVVVVTNVDDETRGFDLSFEGGNSLVQEGGNTATLGVVLLAQPESDVVLGVSSDWSADLVWNVNQLTFSPETWNVSQNLVIEAIDDSVIEPIEQASVTVGIVADQSDDLFGGVAAQIKGVTIEDNDEGDFVSSVQGASLNVKEKGTGAVVSLSLASQPSGPVVVEGNILDVDTAVFGNGQGTISVSLDATSWNTGKSVTILGRDNDTIEIGGSRQTEVEFQVGLRAGRDRDFDAAPKQSFDIFVEDDDLVGLVVTQTKGETIVAEGSGSDSVNVSLSSEPSASVLVEALISEDADVRLSSDFSGLEFGPSNWDSPQSVSVFGRDDSMVDGDSSSVVTLSVEDSSLDANFHGVTSAFTVTTQDDDQAALIAEVDGEINPREADSVQSVDLSLTSQPTQNVTIVASVTEGVSQVFFSGGDQVIFTPENWNQVQSLSLRAIDDAVIDGDVGFKVQFAVNTEDEVYSLLAPVELDGVALDNDEATISVVGLNDGFGVTEGGASSFFEVQLDAKPSGEVLLGLRIGNLFALGLDTTILRYTSNNWNVPQRVTVTAVDDVFVESIESVALTLYVIRSGDPNFAKLRAQSFPVIVNDDDEAGFAIEQPSAKPTVNESGTSAEFGLQLTGRPLTSVVFRVSSLDIGELSIAEPSRLLTFDSDNWNVAQAITVSGVDDFLLDGEQKIAVSVVVRKQGSDTLFQSLPSQTFQVSVSDDDEAGFSFVDREASIEVSEDGDTSLFGVRLNAQPGRDVVLDLASSDSSEFSVAPLRIQFTPSNWNTPQTVTITGQDDGEMVDGDSVETLTVAVDAAASDERFSTLGVVRLSVTNRDNDDAGFRLSSAETNPTLREGGVALPLELVLEAKPIANVVFDVVSEDPNLLRVEPASITFDSSNWNTARTIDVVGIDNSEINRVAKSKLTVSVAAESDTHFRDIDSAALEISIEDDDRAGFTLKQSGGDSLVSEAGTQDQISVRLNAKPQAPVVLSVRSLDTSELSVAPAQLTIPVAQWDQAFEVILTGVDDLLIDGETSTGVRFSVVDAASDIDFRNVLPQVVTVKNEDDDRSGIRVTGAGMPIESGDSDPSFLDQTHFGSVSLDGLSVDAVFSVLSAGASKLTLGGASVSISGDGAADFDVIAQPAAVVAAGESSDFTLRFTPTQVGLRSATVSIANDDPDLNPYTFAVLGVGAVGPAGVTDGLRLWLKAEQGVGSNEQGTPALSGESVRQWMDSSGNEIVLQQGVEGNRPTWHEDAFNFNPGVTFDASSSEFFEAAGLDAFSEGYTLFAVVQTPDATGEYELVSVLSQAGDQAISIGFESNTPAVRFHQRDILLGGAGDLLVAGSPLLGAPNVLSFLRDGQTSHGFYLNGTQESLVSPSVQLSAGEADQFVLGQSGDGMSFFNGTLAELIVFDRVADSERARIDSYLAVKYGVSLDATDHGDYVDSSGNTIWAANDNGDYTRSISGIGRDDVAGLSQLKSRSSLGDDIVTLGHGDLQDPVDLSVDRSFLFWANNDTDNTVVETQEERPEGIFRRLDREWRTSVVGTVGSVDLEFNLEGIDVTGTTASQFFLLVDSDQDGDFTTGSIIGIFASSFGSDRVRFDGVRFETGDIFTLGEIEDGSSLVSQGTNFTLSDSPNRVISDADPSGSLFEIDVTDLPSRVPIKDLNVRMTLRGSRGFNGDMYAYLTRTGTDRVAVLLNRPGKDLTNFFGYDGTGLEDVLFDDQAVNGDVHIYETQLPISTERTALTGEWAPDGRNIDPLFVSSGHSRTATLESFTGVNPNGTWLLYLADLSPGGELVLESWSLEITTETAFTFFGVASDGLIAGGTVFFDANLNGVLDGNEPFTITDQKGDFGLDVLVSEFDRNGDAVLTPDEGRLVVQGGTDISTGLPVVTPFTAPIGASVIHPVTTLIAELMERDPALTPAEAEVTVELALGLDPELAARIDLLTFDIFGEVEQGNPDAVIILAAVAKIQDTVVQVGDLVGGASGFPTAVTAEATFDRMADDLVAGKNLALSDEARVLELVSDVDGAFGQGLSSEEAAVATSIIADGNRIKEEILEGAASVGDTAMQLAQTQVQVQSEVAEDLRAVAEGKLDAQDAFSKNTSVNLRDAVSGAPVGDLSGSEIQVGTFAFDREDYPVTESAFSLNPITIVRSKGNVGTVNLVVSPQSGSADTSDYVDQPISVSFGPFEIRKTINASVLVRDDVVVEGDETLSLALSLGGGSQAGALIGGRSTTQIVIVDNDSVGEVTFEETNFLVREEGLAIRPIRLRRSGGSSGELPVVVGFEALPNGATPGVDFTVGEKTVVFRNGNLNQVVVPPVIEDAIYELDESFRVTLRLADNAPPTARLGQTTSAVVSIREDDPKPAPVLSQIPDQHLTEDGVISRLPFTLTDAHTALDQVQLTVKSSNPNLIPQSGLVISGVQSQKSLLVRPTPNASGVAVITLRANNGQTASESSFQLSVQAVDDPPEILRLVDVDVTSGSGVVLMEFLFADLDSLSETIETSFISGSPLFLPSESIVSVGSGFQRTMRISTPETGSGRVEVTLSVRDESSTVSDRFFINVTEPDGGAEPVDPLVLEPIANAETLEDIELAIPLQIQGEGSAGDDLELQAVSQNQSLVAVDGLVFESDGEVWSLRITPEANQYGRAPITVTATLGQAVVTRSFELVVTPVDDPPVIEAIGLLEFDEDQASEFSLQIQDVDTPLEALRFETEVLEGTDLVTQANVDAGLQEGLVVLRMSPQKDQFGAAVLRLTVADLTSSSAAEFNVQVRPVNDPPLISELPPLTIVAGSTRELELTVADVDTPSEALLVSLESSQPGVLPSEGLIVTRDGGEQVLLSITSPEGVEGDSVITVRATDGALVSEQRINVKIVARNKPPVLTQIEPVEMDEDTVGSVAFEFSDEDSDLASLTFSVRAENQELFPTERQSVDVDGARGLVLLRPAENQEGSTHVELSVSDGIDTVSLSFSVLVRPVNDLPTISVIPSLNLNPGEERIVRFQVSDVDDSLDRLIFALATTNPDLILVRGVEVEGQGGDRQFVLKTAAGKSGTGEVLIGVQDKAESIVARFRVTVAEIPVVPSPVSIARVGDQMQVVWEGDGILHAGSSIDGPFVPVLAANSPYIVDPSTDPQRYFRILSRVENQPKAPGMSISRIGNQLRVTWDGDGVLHGAPSIEGPFQPILNAESPFDVDPSIMPFMFFKVLPEN